MANVFKATQVHGGSYKATNMVMTINGAMMGGHVVQQITMQYQQQISTLFEIGSNNVYYIGGRANGNLNIARVAGPEIVPGIVINAFNDICKPGTMDLTAGSEKCKAGSSFAGGVTGGDYALSGVIITSIGISTQAQDVVVNESMAFQFLDLEVSGAVAGGGAAAAGGGGAAAGLAAAGLAAAGLAAGLAGAFR